MSPGFTGIRLTRFAGAAGVANISLQMVRSPASLKIETAPQANKPCEFSLAIGAALPVTHELSTATLVGKDLFLANESQNRSDPRTEDHRLADLMHAKAEELWRLAARFLASPNAFVLKLTESKSQNSLARTHRVRCKRDAVKFATTISKPNIPNKAKPTKRWDPKPKKKPSKARPHVADTLISKRALFEALSRERSQLPKTSSAISTGSVSAQAKPRSKTSSTVDVAVAAIPLSVEGVVPYPNAQLDRARVVLRAAGVIGGGKATASFAKASASPAVSRNAPEAVVVSKKTCTAEGRGASVWGTVNSKTFKRSSAVGRSPAFLVGNFKTRKVKKAEPVQIVRVVKAGSVWRRIVFSRVPGTKGEYRFAGIEHQERIVESLRRSTPHALAAPRAERQIQPTVLTLAPRGAGESAYTMPDPRELRSDERSVLMGLIKKQLSMGPASLDDPKIREHFNGFMFSNTVGEMSHYVTADQWNAMVRAAILYAARAVLPFSNNSITGMAAEYLFDEADIDSADAERRYNEWLVHFGISGLGDIAMMDTFADEDRVLMMPEYFLKGIMDYLTELAPLMHAYDEETTPFPFTTELHLQWETIAFVHDPAISNDEELVDAATSFTEEIAALDTKAAQHFIELVLLSTLVRTSSIQGVWNEDQAVALVGSSIKAGLSDVVDPIGRNSTLPRRVRRLIAIAKEARNIAENQYQVGLDRLTANLADAIQNGLFSIDTDESTELFTN